MLEPWYAWLALVLALALAVARRRDHAASIKLAAEQRAALAELAEEVTSLREALLSSGAVERPAKPPPGPPLPELPPTVRPPPHRPPRTVADALAGVPLVRPTSSAARTAEAFRGRTTLLAGGAVAPTDPRDDGDRSAGKGAS